MKSTVGETGSSIPVILVVGTTGQVGKLLVEEFDRDSTDVHVRYTARKPEQVGKLRSEGRDAVLLDLDDPRTFAHALHGVDRVYLLTGYTVAMLTQSKTLVDAAVKAGVQHIVHQGVFANWDVTDPHFVWHQMIERYIEGSGLNWTPAPQRFRGKANQYSTKCGPTVVSVNIHAPPGVGHESRSHTAR